MNTLQDADRSKEFSDAHLAGEFAIEVLIDKYCWTAGLGWMKWDGKRWHRTRDEDIQEVCRQWTLDKYKQATERYIDAVRANGNVQVAQAEVNKWKTYLGRNRIDALVDMGKGIVLKDASEFDTHPDLLNVANGIVNLRTGERLEHDPKYMLTKLAPVAFKPGATHKDWDAALEAIPEEIRDWYQVQLGQAITGYMNPDDFMMIQQGGGENGKSTIMNGISAVLGDYFLLVSHRALLSDASSIPAELAELHGARLALMEELPDGRKLDVTRLKMTVGTPQISARRLYKDPFTFEATHTLIISTNYLPKVSETDHGTWRRLVLVKFPYTFRKKADQVQSGNDKLGDRRLRYRIKGNKQKEAILAWLVQGAVEYYKTGLADIPEKVEDDTRNWRKDADLILSYCDEKLYFDPDSHVLTTDLLDDFNNWIHDNGHPVWSKETFASRFGSHDEVTSNYVEKRQMRAKPGLSRPSTDGYFLSAAPSKYRAWVGVAFQ